MESIKESHFEANILEGENALLCLTISSLRLICDSLIFFSVAMFGYRMFSVSKLLCSLVSYFQWHLSILGFQCTMAYNR